MLKNYFKPALYLTPLLLIGLLAGCNSGSGSSSGSGGGNVSSGSIEGRAANGYLYNARVCLDLNDNQRCDEDEPMAWTGREGRFVLENVGSAQSEEYAVVVEVDGNETLDDSGRQVGHDFVMEGVPGRPDFVSPFTTMIRQRMRDNGEDLEAARQHIAARMEIADSEVEMLQGDYLDFHQDDRRGQVADRMQNMAGIITRAMAGLEAELPELDPETAELSEFRARRGAVMAAIIEELKNIVGDVEENGYQHPDNLDRIAGELVERCREGMEERISRRMGSGDNMGPREPRLM